MSDFFVIGLVGLQASGKTEACNVFLDEGGCRVRMGDVVWNEVEERGLKVCEENVGKVAQDLREQEGMGAVAKRCVPLIQEEVGNCDFVVVDGIRGIAEVDVFRDEFGDDFFLVSILASPEVRFNRIKNRDREDDIEDFEQFRSKDERELSWGLEEALEDADFEISNEGSLEDLEKEIRGVLDSVGIGS